MEADIIVLKQSIIELESIVAFIERDEFEENSVDLNEY